MGKIVTLVSLVFLCTSTYVIAQTASTENLEKVIAGLPNDTAKVNRLNELAKKLHLIEVEQEVYVIERSIKLSQDLQYEFGLAVAYGLKASLYISQIKLDSGRLFVDKAYRIIKDKKDIRSRNQVGLLTNAYGVIYQYRELFDSAAEKYIESAKIFVETKNEPKLFYAFYNLANIYYLISNYEKALYYSNKAYASAQKSNDPSFITRGLVLKATAYSRFNQNDSVEIFCKQALAIAYRNNLPFGKGISHMMQGVYFLEKKNQYDSAIIHLNTATAYLQKVNDSFDEAAVLQSLGSAYLMKKDYAKAIVFSKKGYDLTKSLKLYWILQYCLSDLASAEEKLGHTKEAFRYLKEYSRLKDSLQEKNNKMKVGDLEAKYQSEIKEAQIKQLELDKQLQLLTIQKKNTLNYILAGMVIAILIIALLFYVNYRQKQNLQMQRITKLETDKKLNATEAVLKGEEQERTRLAQDLHDGLGGLLSGIKHSFASMKENLLMTPESQQAFERSMDMLDTSIKEMRRVAHNMMPESLVRFGLDTSLKDFCNNIHQSGIVKINYQSIGLEGIVLEQTMAITVYRIFQELVNNVLKHAHASTLIAQVTKSNGQLSVAVEDDGKGFDTAILQQSRGIGWTNIQRRVDFLKGKINVNSSPGKGVSVLIEFKV